MPSAIEVHGLSKQFGAVQAVDDLSFEVMPGRVTGFLGPNGSGKTTTLRVLLGLVSATAGAATFGGRRYVDLDHPVRHVGAVLEATSFHPTRRAEDHLKSVAIGAGIPVSRVDETLALVGLSDVARRRVGKFSLGMRQRLQLATALLGVTAQRQAAEKELGDAQTRLAQANADLTTQQGKITDAQIKDVITFIRTLQK